MLAITCCYQSHSQYAYRPMRIVLEVALFAAGAALTVLGAWLLTKSTFPIWMKGFWKWPLGDNPSRNVAQLMGWSSLLVSLGAVPAAVVLVLWDRSVMARLASLIALFFVGAGTFAWGWGVKPSHVPVTTS